MPKPYIVVVRQLGGIGDCLMLSCVFRGLREKYPKHKLCTVASSLYAGGAVTDIARHNPFIDEVHDISPYDGTPARTREVWNRHYGEGPLLDNNLWFQKADLRIDLNTICMEMEMRATRLQKDIPMIPRYEIWCNHAGVVPSSYKPIYVVTKREAAQAEEFYREKGWNPKECVAVGIGACDDKRNVTIEQITSICNGIKNLGLRPVTFDDTRKIGDHDYVIGKQIKDVMPIIQRMRLAVSVDSGVLHMAGTMDVPVIGLFGPTDQAMRMGQYRGSAIDSSKLMPCAPCWYEFPCLKSHKADDQFACLKKIKPDVVLDEVKRWIEVTA